ncbi:hypothetical protein A3C25_04470 [Candidatus Roizmanbacteria bacterium RIFCSPHIGHO2_02_FULL_38_11]|uniref:Uncharacterized protein n=1 Tax=Candidatus Roizmanbacteria bacterium RIFCSPHIGHO2_02_FULL_38_11 TaxID=1802039 RepID=A0A1F7GZA1_9BACT|nr:MAG: hypothetical protein A3C25_04470 [Candidatus Roizmanbacteria bacterium RIFCSPHIGHO2_02_FULL_38_11]
MTNERYGLSIEPRIDIRVSSHYGEAAIRRSLTAGFKSIVRFFKRERLSLAPDAIRIIAVNDTSNPVTREVAMGCSWDDKRRQIKLHSNVLGRNDHLWRTALYHGVGHATHSQLLRQLGFGKAESHIPPVARESVASWIGIAQQYEGDQNLVRRYLGELLLPERRLFEAPASPDQVEAAFYHDVAIINYVYSVRGIEHLLNLALAAPRALGRWQALPLVVKAGLDNLRELLRQRQEYRQRVDDIGWREWEKELQRNIAKNLWHLVYPMLISPKKSHQEFEGRAENILGTSLTDLTDQASEWY